MAARRNEYDARHKESNEMLNMTQAANAYAVAAAHRNVREQEADIFRRANASLREGGGAGPLGRARALADNHRLWMSVMDLMRDPENALPAPLRAAIVSVGHTVQREMRQPVPNFEFLISINENIAAGLSGQP
jgi:flagellar protein FlaF